MESSPRVWQARHGLGTQAPVSVLLPAVSAVSLPTASPLGGRHTWDCTQMLIVTCDFGYGWAGQFRTSFVSLPAHSVWFHTYLCLCLLPQGSPEVRDA